MASPAQQDMFFDSDGVQIRYTVQGEGEPVVLIHGFFLDLETNWIQTGAMDALHTAYRVVALDLRGHGRSGKPHGHADYGTEMIRDVTRLMNHLQIENAHIVGYSMGGEITLKMLDVAPDRFRTAVIGGAGWMQPGDFKHQSWKASADTLATVKPGESIMAAFAPPEDRRPSEEMQAIIDRNDAAALAALSRSMLDMTVSEATLRSNRVPTLVVFGEHDWIRPNGDALPGVMANLTMRVLPGEDHGSVPASDAFKHMIRSFIADPNAVLK